MRTRNHDGRRASLALAALLFLPAAAGAQSSDQAPTQPPTTQGPMVIERVPSGFLFAPEFKVTDFANKTSGLVGGYAGWLTDQTFFVGGGAYFLTDWSHDRELGYGGLVLGWTLPEDRVAFTAKTLIGGGIATRTALVSYPPYGPPYRPVPVHDGNYVTYPPYYPGGITTTAWFHDDIFVFEPEASVSIKLHPGLRLAGSVGYRVTAGGASLPANVSGVTGGVSLQIGGGS